MREDVPAQPGPALPRPALAPVSCRACSRWPLLQRDAAASRSGECGSRVCRGLNADHPAFLTQQDGLGAAACPHRQPVVRPRSVAGRLPKAARPGAEMRVCLRSQMGAWGGSSSALPLALGSSGCRGCAWAAAELPCLRAARLLPSAAGFSLCAERHGGARREHTPPRAPCGWVCCSSPFSLRAHPALVNPCIYMRSVQPGLPAAHGLQVSSALETVCQGAHAQQVASPNRRVDISQDSRNQCTKITKQNTNYFGIHIEMATYATHETSAPAESLAILGPS